MMDLGAQVNDMTDYQTGAVRDTGSKGRMDLLPWAALIRVSRHMENVIKPDPVTHIAHYPERNWEKGLPIHCMIDSAFRHLAKYMDGWTDEDHLCAAASNILMAMWTEEKLPNMQDVPSRISSLRSESSGVYSPLDDTQGQEKTTESKGEVLCEYYHDNHLWGNYCEKSGEHSDCLCRGNLDQCDYELSESET